MIGDLPALASTVRREAAPVRPEPTPFAGPSSPCPLCKCKRSRTVLEATDPWDASGGESFAVARCESCGMRFTNPRPGPEAIGRYYPAAYQPHRRPESARRPLRKWYPLSRLTGRPSERKSLPHHGQRRLLDFGCGGGSFLLRMADQGWRVTGVDSCGEVAESLKATYGLNVLTGTLPHAELSPESFDVITMWHSLEHVHDPLATLREAHRLLAPGGRLLVAVPNIDSWPARHFGADWFGLDLPRHLSHFTPSTLRTAIERAGFDCAAVRLIRHADWLRSSAKLAVSSGSGGRLARALCKKGVARFAAWACYAAGQSDCMYAVAERR